MNAAVCMLDAAARRFEHRVAVEDEHEALTYGAYRARSLAIASAMLELGSNRRPVVVYLPKSVDMLCTFMGACMSVAPTRRWIPIFPWRGSKRSSKAWSLG